MRFSFFCFAFVQGGRTALYFAAWKGHNEVVSLLVESHADINLPDQVMPGCRILAIRKRSREMRCQMSNGRLGVFPIHLACTIAGGYRLTPAMLL